jgi:hypothetical protein
MDFQNLNKASLKDDIPLPHIDIFVDNVPVFPHIPL